MSEVSKSGGTLDYRFWAIFPGICLSSFLCALDSTIISNALPTIAHSLHSASLYTWGVNGYTIAFTAVQPLYGQAADIFGRKSSMIASLVLFGTGSIICGVARTTATFIAGRAVQGCGGGGLSILPAMIVCDLVPLRQRQSYVGIIYAAFALGTFIGPVIGGTLAQHGGWPWIFWINLPCTGIALGLIAVFLRVHHNREGSLWACLARVDYAGNALLMSSLVSMLYALSTGGARYPWNSWQVLVPLLLGICFGLPLYLWFETTSWCRKPTTPLRLFANRTSAMAFSITFVHGIVMYWASYFLPVYFQSVLLKSPEQSGIDNLPALLPAVPCGILGGILVSKIGRYRPNQIAGFALCAISFGCFTLFNQSTSTAFWATMQLILAAGEGLVLTALLPAIQANLPESDVGSSTATWGLIQSLGFVCGFAIPASIYDSRVTALLQSAANTSVTSSLAQGNVYEYGTRAYLLTLPEPLRNQIIAVFVAALRLVWQVGLGLALLGFVLALFLPEVVLREDLDTEYGYRERRKIDDGEKGQGVVKSQRKQPALIGAK